MDRGRQGQTGGHLRSSRVSEGAVIESWKERKAGDMQRRGQHGQIEDVAPTARGSAFGVKEVCYKGDSWI